MVVRHIETPITEDIVKELKTGERVLLTGYIFTARDLAHKRFMEILDKGDELPIDIRNQILYYCGPSPAPPGKIIGACGPTTSSRMDIYTPRLLSMGLKGMIGKGKRSESVKEAIKRYHAIYFGATGGAGAFLSRCVISCDVVCFEEFGPEAVFKLFVKDMPLIVINDIYGNDLYEEGIKKYKRP